MEILTRKIAAARPVAAPDHLPVMEQPVAPVPGPEPIRWAWLAAVAVVALLPSVVLAVLYQRTLDSTRSLSESNTRLAALVEEQQAQLATLQQAARTAASGAIATATATNKVTREAVPYGETPLAGARQERLREMVEGLRAGGFKGRIRAATFAGEFCLTGNGIEGYSIAADDLPVKRCDLIGNPFEDSLTAAQRQSLGFANLVASVPQQTSNAITVEVSNAGRVVAVPYPEGESLTKATAGEWNRIAAQNNRVEFVAEAE